MLSAGPNEQNVQSKQTPTCAGGISRKYVSNIINIAVFDSLKFCVNCRIQTKLILNSCRPATFIINGFGSERSKGKNLNSSVISRLGNYF